MNRIQQNECLVQLPIKISHLPECVPELFWLSVSKCHEHVCLSKFRAPFQTPHVWIECVKHLTLYAKWQIVPGSDSDLSILDYCCKDMIGNVVGLYEKIRSSKWTIKLPNDTPLSMFANGVKNFHNSTISFSALASIICVRR